MTSSGQVCANVAHKHKGFSSFACILAETTDGRTIVYKQYRHGSRRTGLVFPGGHLEPDEAPLEAAKRELLEPIPGSNSVVTLSTPIKEGRYPMCSTRPAVVDRGSMLR
jgi:hypothetical protein